MSMTAVTMVRVYCTESDGRLEKVLKLLHDEVHVAGVTVFRGMRGFGPSGKWHGSDWLDMSLDLPVTIEFFDRPGAVAALLDQLNTLVAPGHLVSWQAHANLED
jgi:PII-like signaling protein